MSNFNSGPTGMLLMLVGGLLAASSAWTALTGPGWVHTLPSILIGLSLVAIGYSLVSRARRDAHRRKTAAEDDD